MKSMKRLLAFLLAASMLFGSNGITFAAEAAADEANGVAQETVVQEEAEENNASENDADQEVDDLNDENEDSEVISDQDAGSDGTTETADTTAPEEENKEDESAPATEDASAGEGASEEPAGEIPAEQENKPVYSAGELLFKGKDYQVTLSYDEKAEIPADAKLEVEEIGKDDPRYESYFEEAASAVDKSVTDARFFDITIWANGTEIQPQSQVRVNITYDEAIKVEDEAEVQAVHFEKEDEDPKVLDIETNDGSKVDEIAFDAPSFSVYGVLYTVDFQFEGFTFSIAGNSTILLSELAQKLNFYGESESKTFSVEDVADVAFTNDELIKIEKQEDGDWLLTSLQAFSTKETLTITMVNGDQFVVEVTDAANALTINTSLYDYDDATVLPFPSDFSTDNVYAFVYAGGNTELKNLPDNTPWAVVDMNGIKGSGSPFTVNVDSFNNQAWGGGNVAYSSLTDEQKQNLRVRVIHTDSAPKLGDLKNWANYEQAKFEKIWNGGFDGYDLSSAHASGSKPEGNYEVNFKKGNTQEHDVTLKFNPTTDKGPIPAGKYYVMFDAVSQDGNNHYYNVVEVKTDGSTDTVNLPLNEIWSSNQKFSNNWQSITATVITPKAGKTITPGGNKPIDGDYIESYLMGDYFYKFKERKTEIDEEHHIQRDEFIYELSKATYDNAKTPDDILGEAAEFGIVADTYSQTGHSETNYAVKNLNHNANTDVCGSGSGYMPFYVSNITGPSLDIDQTFCPIDLYIPADQDSKLHSHIQELKDSTFTEPEEIAGVPKLTEINMTHAEIESYVDGLISSGKQTSTALASKSTMKPVLSGNNKTVDTTQFPDGKTIYVDCTDCKDIIGTSGWIINKLPNQSIVFNIPGENVSIGEFHVNVYNESGEKIDESGSTTDARDDGTSEKNRKVDEIIFDHISFNAYQAKTLDLNNASALFLAPEAETVTQSNGAGWILAKGTVDSHAEWHFYRHSRHYKSKGDFSLSGQKKIMEGDAEKEYSEFSSMTFTFELYACDESGTIAPDANAIETVTANSTGEFKFNSLKFSHNDVPEGETRTFYYVIKEQVPEGGKVDGVKYDADPVRVKVVATDDGSGNISFVISTMGDEGWSDAITPDDDKVYEIGDFANTLENGSLKVKKIVNGDNAKNDQYEIAVKNSAGHYFGTDGTDKGTTAFYVTFAKDQEQTWSNLPAGTYTVEEKDASVSGYTWTPSGTGDVAVAAGQTATADVTNAYVKHTEAELKAEKNFTGRNWKPTDSFEFILKPVGDAPMPSDAETTEAGKQKKVTARNATAVSFGTIPYTEAGTYNYTITETKGNLPGVTYDTTPHTVKVAVNEDNNKHLVATVTYDKGTDAQEITNTFEDVTTHFEATKEIENWGTAESFTFTLTARTPSDAPMPAASGRTATATKDDTTAVFGDIKYEAPGTYVYVIKETDDHVPGITYDTSDHIVTVVVSQDNDTNELSATVTYGTGEDAESSLTITNTFTKVEATLKATKSINNWGSAESFTFTLAPVEGAPMPGDAATVEKTVTKGGSLEAVFGTIEYGEVGQYKYTITETDDGVPGVTYDTTPHEVIVDVHKAADSNALVADVTYDGESSLTIVNSYASTELALQATKSINEWGDAESFTFKLAAGKSLVKGVEGTSPMPASDTATATEENPTALFGSVKYEEEGTYNYTITEVDDHVAGITYDTTPHTVVVTVAKNASGDLVASAKYDTNKDSLTITNTFTSLKKQLEATKAIEEWGKATSFTFKLEAVNGAPMPASDTATVTKGGSMKAVFGEIEYKTTGEYDYTITEKNDHVDGVTYDTTPHPVHVSVTKNETTNALEATITYGKGEAEGSNLTITNTFAAVEAELQATKDFDSWGKATSFTFNLAAVSAVDDENNAISPIPVPASMTAQATQAATTASFGKIKYDQAGTYTYTITEQNGGVDGVSYDTTPHTAVVTVSKDPETNALTASVEYDDGEESLTITNTYASTKATLEATKDFADWGKADEFKFDLAAVTEGAPMPTSTTATATKDVPLASFGEIEYEEAGTYEYTITEQNGGADGVTYDTTPHKVVVTVTKAEDATNKLTATVKYDDADSLTITNTYTSVKKELEATKQLDDWGTADSFTFTLKAKGDAPMPADAEDGAKSVDVTENATLAKFGEIEYEKEGTYEYTITEEPGDADGVTYDTTDHTAVVTVTKDPETNALSATVKYDGGNALIITNRYASSNVELQAKKQFEDWGKADSFTFTLEPVSKDAPMPEGTSDGKKTATATQADPTAKFGKITYKTTGTYEYTITETDDGKDGVTYDTTPHKVVVTVTKDADNKLVAVAKYDDKENLIITNTYEATKASLEATKSFEYWGKADSFTFDLEALENAPMPAGAADGKKSGIATSANPVVNFGEITFEKAGVYAYTITEQNGGADGVSYDTTPHGVVVTVTKGEGNKLSAEVKYDDAESLTITNTYASTKATIEATKDFEDWGKATEFKFDLAAVTENAPMPSETTATATEQNPLASFGEIEYEKAGTYEYTITEQNGGADGVTYDTTAHKVKVVVTKANDATNKLTATVTYDDAESLTITNTYAATEATLEATKDFADWGKADEFKFDLAAVTEGAPMPASTTATATKNAPIASFGTIKYEKAGTYEYTITEQNGGADGVTYDTTAHKVVVTVTKADDATNKLTASVKYDGADSLTITNTYSAVRTRLQATKDFNAWGKAESFTFELRAVDGAPMPLEGRVDGDVAYAVATEDSVDAVFGAIEFEKAGTYKYTITEADDGVDGVTYDTTPHQVVVTVTKEDGTNRLIPSVKYDDKDLLIITNTFASASVTLQAMKDFADWGKADSFTFTLDAVTKDAPMPEKTVVAATENAKTAVFGSVTYEKAGTYEYTITETDDGVDGVTYDTTPHKAVVTVVKGDGNKLTATVKYDGENNLVITNTYEAAKAELEAEKAFDDWGKADSFTFELAAVDGAPMPEGSTNGKKSAIATETQKKVNFGEIAFEKAGEYKYTITEQNGGADGVSYDTTPHNVVVTVTKGDGNKLTAAVKYDDKDSLIITNTYAATEAELKATKDFADWGKADSFTFKLAAVTEGAPMPEQTTAEATEAAPEATFGMITYEKAGTYKYTITEVNDGMDGVTYDTTPHEVTVVVTKADDATNALTAEVKYDGKDSLIITNTYAATKATLEATKEFNDWGKAESFTFNLKAVTKDAPMPEKTEVAATEDEPTAVFGEITFEKAGTYEYEITEVNDGVDGVTYDTTAHKAVVTVSKEEGTNKLSASVKYDGKDSLIITNTFTAVEATLEATKDFNDWGKAESFTFDLAAVTEGAPMPEDTEAVATKENVNAVFGKVTYDKAGTYEYTITERNDGADGVTYDTTAHKVVVEVSKEEGTNKLSASVKYDGKDTLIVTNTYASTSATIQATKKFDDWGKADSFTFDLAAVTEGAPMPENKVATATESAKTAVFGSVEYEKTGKYEYTITERNDGVDGVTYDTTAHKVVVTVTKDADNKMIAKVTYDGESSLIITNTFTAAKANFEATKEFNDWGKADSFTFDLAAATDGAPMPAETTATATEGKKAVFGEMEFDKAGVYEYTITEQNGGADGVSYDVTPHTATVVVTKDAQTNELSAEVTYDGEKELIITNTFTAAIAHVEATKVLENRDWFNADEFEFELAAVTEGAPMPKAKTAKATKEEPTAVFGDMEFVKAGTYQYTITEKDGGIEGITYDTEPHGVTVTVSKADDETNELTVNVNYDGKDKLEITNKYASEGEIILKVKKELKGRNIALDDGVFEFQLMDEDGNVLQTAKNDAFGNVEFDKISYTQDDIDSWDAEKGTGTGTKTYKVKEIIQTKDGYTFDESELEITVTLTDDGKGAITAEADKDIDDLVFKNEYEAEGEIVLHAQKTLLGERALEEGQFTFVLKDAGGETIDTKTNAADGSVTFDALKYTQDDVYDVDPETGVYSGAGTKTYTYTISEVIPEGAKDNGDGTYDYKGYTYDGTVYTVDVVLTDNGDGTITVVDAADGTQSGSTDPAAEAGTEPTDSEPAAESRYVFTNAYDAKGTLKLDAEKTFKNATLKGGEFTFELKDADGNVLQSKTNDAAGNVSFDMIAYTMADVKNSPITYTVVEKAGSKEGVKYDQTVYTVTATLEDNGDGTLNVTKKIDNGGELKFVNEQMNVETSITIGGVKVLKGQNLKAGQFKFVLVDENGKKIDEAKNDASGDFTFGTITYKLSDLGGEKKKVFTYGISEVEGTDRHIIYDKKVHTVVVTVTDNGDGTMTAKMDKSRADIKFVNTTRDKTGDEAPLGVLFGGLGIGAAGLAVLLEERRRRGRRQ